MLHGGSTKIARCGTTATDVKVGSQVVVVIAGIAESSSGWLQRVSRSRLGKDLLLQLASITILRVVDLYHELAILNL